MLFTSISSTFSACWFELPWKCVVLHYLLSIILFWHSHGLVETKKFERQQIYIALWFLPMIWSCKHIDQLTLFPRTIHIFPLQLLRPILCGGVNISTTPYQFSPRMIGTVRKMLIVGSIHDELLQMNPIFVLIFLNSCPDFLEALVQRFPLVLRGKENQLGLSTSLRTLVWNPVDEHPADVIIWLGARIDGCTFQSSFPFITEMVSVGIDRIGGSCPIVEPAIHGLEMQISRQRYLVVMRH